MISEVTVTFFNVSILENALIPKLFNFLGRYISDKWVPLKALLPISVRCLGNTIDVKPECSKAPVPIFVIPLGKLIWVRLGVSEKTYPEISVKVSGSSTTDNLLSPEKAPSLIVVTPSDRLIFVNALLLAKASLPIIFTLEGKLISSIPVLLRIPSEISTVPSSKLTFLRFSSPEKAP